MYKKALIFYLSISGFSLIFSGCCPDPYTVTSEYSAYFGDISNACCTTMLDQATDTITEAFVYRMEAIVIAEHSVRSDLNLYQSAYALSCDDEYLNPYTELNASLTLNKPFILDGNPVPAGTNFFDLALTSFTYEEMGAYVLETSLQAEFRQGFIDRVQFPLDTYTFTASVTMQDGTIVTSTESVMMLIN
jgi:hypothetical protein